MQMKKIGLLGLIPTALYFKALKDLEYTLHVMSGLLLWCFFVDYMENRSAGLE